MSKYKHDFVDAIETKLYSVSLSNVPHIAYNNSRDLIDFND